MTTLALMISLAVVAVALVSVNVYRTTTAATPIAFNWRGLLARLPLPMLALAASYGVYSFALLFVPTWVAVCQAAAFELTYVGLAVTQGLDTPQRKRATGISIGAVAASIIYNTLAGWFHAQPQLIADATAIAWLCLAILHGAPLAWVAYLVADLLLHSAPAAVAAAVVMQPAPAVRSVYAKDILRRARSPSARRASHMRRARRRENGGSFTEIEWRDLCDAYNNRCLRCGQQRNLTADHVVSLLAGGTSNIDNIQPLCRPCNSSKGARTEDYRNQPHPDCVPDRPRAASAPETIAVTADRKTVPVDSRLLAAYLPILAVFDHNPLARTADLALAANISTRTAESRRSELVKLGALHKTDAGYVRNGAELIADER